LADHGLTEQDIEVVLLQHAGRPHALFGHQGRRLGRARPDDGQADRSRARGCSNRKPDSTTYGVLNVNEQFAADHPEIVRDGESAPMSRRGAMRWRIR